jgi:hypothetical protein
MYHLGALLSVNGGVWRHLIFPIARTDFSIALINPFFVGMC